MKSTLPAKLAIVLSVASFYSLADCSSVAGNSVSSISFFGSQSCPNTTAMTVSGVQCALTKGSGFNCITESNDSFGGPYVYTGSVYSGDNGGSSGDGSIKPIGSGVENNYDIVGSTASPASSGSVENAFVQAQSRNYQMLTNLQSNLLSRITYDNSQLKSKVVNELSYTRSDIQYLSAEVREARNETLELHQSAMQSVVDSLALQDETLGSTYVTAQDTLRAVNNLTSQTGGSLNAVNQQIGGLRSDLGRIEGGIARIEANAASKFDVSQSENNITSQMGEQFGQIMSGIYSTWTPTIQKVDDAYAALSDQIANVAVGPDAELHEKVDQEGPTGF
ncbi:hypothetical protein [Rheinheimera sp.]|uniref:hypothetical protein n=1 Tax=Rheinheimera sp. TaxID=1869214 RepID=UPI00307FB0FD